MVVMVKETLLILNAKIAEGRCFECGYIENCHRVLQHVERCWLNREKNKCKRSIKE